MFKPQLAPPPPHIRKHHPYKITVIFIVLIMGAESLSAETWSKTCESTNNALESGLQRSLE